MAFASFAASSSAAAAAATAAAAAAASFATLLGLLQGAADELVLIIRGELDGDALEQGAPGLTRAVS